ncbi:uncharacterized protein CXQ87_003606 [Candidozyma duobushaemuli]|uniref:Uncharacterized protein n=2 Tax=Candidozyma TaxID=3303203 RepID=A0ABX8I756_9ASCO|nr:uncharacterized protein CXQ87_003606 [[Candida] duobushaemulonis]PVH15757.1 hypothetical protein CXQ87_003606 [[Candida] duobushaemulonis]QWU88934.1 hypothetical protein CA3LBN_003242 [[Candida] haemuloni]
MPAVSTASTITKASKKKSFPKKTSTDRGSLKESDAHIREKKLKDKKRKRSKRKRTTNENPLPSNQVKEEPSNEGDSNSTPSPQVSESKPVEPTKEKKKSKQKFLSNEGDSYYISDFFSFQLILEGFVPLNPGQVSDFKTQKNEPCPEVKESEPEVIFQVEPKLPEPVNPIQTSLPEPVNPIQVTPEPEVIPAISPKSVTNYAQVATLLPLDFPVFKTWSSLSQTEKTYYPGDFYHFRKCLKEEEPSFLPKEFYFWKETVSEKSAESFDIEDFFEFQLISEELLALEPRKKTAKQKKVFLVNDGQFFVTDFFSFQTIAESLESLDGELSDYEFCLREEQFDLYSEEPVKTQEVYFPDDFCKFFQLWTSSPKYNRVFLPNDFYFWKDATNDEDTPSFLPRDFFHWQSIFNERSNESFLPQDFCFFQNIIESVEPPFAPETIDETKASNLPSERSTSEFFPRGFVPWKSQTEKVTSYLGVIFKLPKNNFTEAFTIKPTVNPQNSHPDEVYESDSSEQSSLFEMVRHWDADLSDSEFDVCLDKVD